MRPCFGHELRAFIIYEILDNNLLYSYPTQGGSKNELPWKPLYCRSLNSKDVAPSQGPMKWNELDESWKMMEWNFGQGKTGETPRKTRPRFIHHETKMELPRREFGTPAVGVERLTACVTISNRIVNDCLQYASVNNHLAKYFIISVTVVKFSQKHWIVREQCSLIDFWLIFTILALIIKKLQNLNLLAAVTHWFNSPIL